MSKSLLEAAVLEAKQVRAATIENAKQTVYESITPHIKQMLAAKLEEEFDGEDEDPIEEATDSGFTKVAEPKSKKPTVKEAEEEESEDDPEETGDEDQEDVEDVATEEPEEDDEQSEEPEAEEEEESEEDDRDISDLSVEEFKDVIRDIVAQELGNVETGEEVNLGADMDGGDVEGMGEEEPSMDLGAEDDIEGDEEMGGEEGEVEDGFGTEEDEEEIDISEVLKELENSTEESEEDVESVKQELQEAHKVITKLKKTLQEVNLLNSKLLYLNKVLDRNVLSEDQRVKVITAFDKATTVKEVRLVFETIQESFTKSTKKPVLREHRGSASKAAGVAPKRPQILAEDAVVNRWQKLAGIIKD